MSVVRLAIVASHPVQYYAPWFTKLAARPELQLRVFYLWGGTGSGRHDPGFGRDVVWDLDLLSGYSHEFVPNTARRPGTDHFNGLTNPSLPDRLRAWKPDVVLAIGYGWRALTSLALTWKDSPLWLRGDTHRIGRDQLPAWRRFPQRWLTRRLLSRYAGFAAVGQAHRDFLVAHGVSPERIHHVPHCVDNDRWSTSTRAAKTAASELRAELGIPAHRRLVLFVGKFEPKKRPDLLIKAFQQAAVPDSALLLVGDGPLRDQLRANATENPSIFWLPFQNQRELPRIYAAADLLVLPSEGHQETWGLVVNEAMASGIPCLVSDHVGCRADLIQHGQTGWSFPAGNLDALAHTLRAALATLSDAEARESLRAAIAKRIADYSYDAAATTLVRALQSFPCS